MQNEWSLYFKHNEIIKLIRLDISRTYQNKELFKKSEIQEILIKILFAWSIDNEHISYRQGMNEILAIILLAIYPFYTSTNKKDLKFGNMLTNHEENLLLYSKEIFYFLHDEAELPFDLYILFDLFMKNGLMVLYSNQSIQHKKEPYVKEEFKIKSNDLFTFKYGEKYDLMKDVSKF